MKRLQRPPLHLAGITRSDFDLSSALQNSHDLADQSDDVLWRAARLEADVAQSTSLPMVENQFGDRVEPAAAKHQKNRRVHAKRRRMKDAAAQKVGHHPPTSKTIQVQIAAASHIQTTAVQAAFPVAINGFIGLRGRPGEEGRIYKSLDEALASGLKLIRWDGKTPRPILSKEGRVVAVLAGQPDTPGYRSAHHAAYEAMMEAAAQEDFKETDIHHKRGKFPVVNVGVTMGLGATYPTNLATGRHTEMMDNLLSHPAIIQMANFADAAFNLWAPHLHKKYRDHLFSLWDHHPDLRRIFARSIYPAAAFNFGPNVFTVTHRDCMNAPGGLCAIQALGNFDPMKGGHMVFPSLGLVVEFPPGALILVPSAIVTHGNIPVQEGDVRGSFTQYCAGGLFRYVQNGFCTEGVLKRENPKEYMRISSLKATRWASDYELFSRLTDLLAPIDICTGQKQGRHPGDHL
ncbi:hypothetical protein H0H92_014845 [Tricholoma furcatifolium]|nr:hypothetical protein H0H92_014845 [Tricholoma furcatifolium]